MTQQQLIVRFQVALYSDKDSSHIEPNNDSILEDNDSDLESENILESESVSSYDFYDNICSTEQAKSVLQYFKEYSNHDNSSDIYISKLRFYKNNDLFEAIVKVKNWSQENEENMDKLVESIKENLWPEKNTDCPCFITINDEVLELVFDIQRVYKVSEKRNKFVTKIQEIYPYSDEEEDYYYDEEYDYYNEEESEESEESEEPEKEEDETEESINDDESVISSDIEN